MFRKLAETFQVDEQAAYLKDQNTYFNALPNIIPSTSGLKGFNVAIRNVEPVQKQYSLPISENVFIQPGGSLDGLAKQCTSSSLDDLIASKNPNAPVGCGWLYTPPKQNSPYAILSQGFIGNNDGPLNAFSPPPHSKWFYDLASAKESVLMDKCKALKSCKDLDTEPYKGVCGYCTDTNQGIPIDSEGNPLYPRHAMGNCSTQSIVTSTDKCPVANVPNGPVPSVNNTCDPVNGRLPAACLYNTVISGGCSSEGALALALGGSPPPNNYMAGIQDGDAVKIYNRVANPPLKLDIFRQGATTVNTVLQEVRQLAANVGTKSSMGAAARDLCLQKGSLSSFDFCAELVDSTPSPFDLNCLQKMFRKLGGQPAGSAYPSQGNITTYNNMGTLGAVKQYWSGLFSSLKSSDYSVQRSAMIKVLGIVPEKMIVRAPYTQGIEVFWFAASVGNPNSVAGLLKRTTEVDFPQFGGASGVSSTGVIPQVGFVQYSAMLPITDIRVEGDTAVKWQITADDGFWMSSGQPADFDYKAFETPVADQMGYCANNQMQGPTQYNFNSCQTYSPSFPNITKFFYQDSGGGGHTFSLNTIMCSGTKNLVNQMYSLTLEPRAPFLNFEVNSTGGAFEDTRIPAVMSKLVSANGTEIHSRTDERLLVPAKKGFLRFNSARSSLNITNIAYQSWGTMTFAIRLQSMPVKDTICEFVSQQFYLSIIATPISGSLAGISIEHNITGTGPSNGTTIKTPFQLGLNTWYQFKISNTGNGLSISCDTINAIILNGGSYSNSAVSLQASTSIYVQNGLTNSGNPSVANSACYIVIGTNGFSGWRGMYGSPSFNYDIAWVHFYDFQVNGADMVKDCQGSWVFTEFPVEYNTYKGVDM